MGQDCSAAIRKCRSQREEAVTCSVCRVRDSLPRLLQEKYGNVLRRDQAEELIAAGGNGHGVRAIDQNNWEGVRVHVHPAIAQAGGALLQMETGKSAGPINNSVRAGSAD